METIFYTATDRSKNETKKIAYPFQKLVAPFYQFGRLDVINWLHFKTCPSKILQIGDSSNWAQRKLKNKFPTAEFAKMDFVEMTIDQSTTVPYAESIEESMHNESKQFDLILMSYQLSHRFVDWRSKVRKASEMLSPNGQIALVDYHGKFKGPVNQLNAYRTDELEDFLFEEFDSFKYDITPAYAGLWSYFKFIGVKKGNENY